MWGQIFNFQKINSMWQRKKGEIFKNIFIIPSHYLLMDEHQNYPMVSLLHTKRKKHS